MLTAVQQGKLVLAATAQSGNQYYCPECHQPVILKRGQMHIPHFAHQAHSHCVISEGETYEHLLGKQQMFEWAGQQNWLPEMERYHPTISQRADVLVHPSSSRQPIALEFQCSPLSLESHLLRNQGYRSVHWRYYWILGSPYHHQLTKSKQAQFLHSIDGEYCLLYWDIQQAQLIKQPLIRQERKWSYQLASLKKLHNCQLTKLNQNICQRGLSMDLCPLFCHDYQSYLPFTQHELLLWRIQLAVTLMTIPLFQLFNLSEWYYLLRTVGNDEWNLTPCLHHCLAQLEWQNVTTSLIADKIIIKTANNQIMLIQHPTWYSTLDSKRWAVQQHHFTFNHHL